MAAVAAVLKDVEELVAVKTIGKSRQDLALADTIANSEAGRYFSTKSNVGELADIHVDDEPHEDGAELGKHLTEEDRKLADIKGFTFVHTTAKDIRAISHEVADSIYSCPGTHIC